MNENEKTLKEWQEDYHDISEYQKLFYVMDKTMKNVHQYQYYITNFNPSVITVGTDKNNQEYVVYQSMDKISDADDVDDIIKKNIYNDAFLQVGLYSETLDYLTPQFLKDNFDRFTLFLPEKDVPYYRRVLLQHASFYYSDFKSMQNEQMAQQLESSLENDASSKGQSNGGNAPSLGTTKQKSTMAGRLFSADDDNKMAAFAQYYVLPFIVIALSLLIPLTAWLIALSS